MAQPEASDPLEPSDYKHVALGLIFLKHISTAFEAKLGFGHLCGVAERMDDAVAEGWAEFRRLACAPGREETLLAPELAPNRGERVGEGGPLLAVPGGGRDLEPGVAAEAGGEQGDDGGKGGQGGGGEGAGVGLPPPPGPR